MAVFMATKCQTHEVALNSPTKFTTYTVCCSECARQHGGPQMKGMQLRLFESNKSCSFVETALSRLLSKRFCYHKVRRACKSQIYEP